MKDGAAFLPIRRMALGEGSRRAIARLTSARNLDGPIVEFLDGGNHHCLFRFREVIVEGQAD